MWDLPGPGIKPVSPALEVRFLSIVPPGKSASIHSATHGLRSNFDFRVLLFKKHISYAIAAIDCDSSDEFWQSQLKIAPQKITILDAINNNHGK